ncbi:MAG: hypothetical protein AB7O88_23695 [Reyranellaceae bacterium]
MSDALRGKCRDCGHVWIVAHLPMALETAAKLALAALCPKCGSRKIGVATGTDGESA